MAKEITHMFLYRFVGLQLIQTESHQKTFVKNFDSNVRRSWLCRFGLAPISHCVRGTTDHSITTAVSSVTTPSTNTAFRVNLLEGIILAHPAPAAEQVFGYSCAAYSETVAPDAVTSQKLTHIFLSYLNIMIFLIFLKGVKIF